MLATSRGADGTVVGIGSNTAPLGQSIGGGIEGAIRDSIERLRDTDGMAAVINAGKNIASKSPAARSRNRPETLGASPTSNIQ